VKERCHGFIEVVDGDEDTLPTPYFHTARILIRADDMEKGSYWLRIVLAMPDVIYVGWYIHSLDLAELKQILWLHSSNRGRGTSGLILVRYGLDSVSGEDRLALEWLDMLLD